MMDTKFKEALAKQHPAAEMDAKHSPKNKLPFASLDSSTQSLLELEDFSDGKGADGSDSDRLIPLEEEEPEKLAVITTKSKELVAKKEKEREKSSKKKTGEKSKIKKQQSKEEKAEVETNTMPLQVGQYA